jgi:hypothetical protein
METVLATGADERYGYWLLNMIGSVKSNSDLFDRIVAYDLGLDTRQRRLLDNVRDVEVRSVPSFKPRWREGRAWKAWIFTHLEAQRLVWLDAGLTVLRPLSEVLVDVDDHEYFAVSQGIRVSETVPADYYELLDFPRELGDRISIAAGVIAFDRHTDFYRNVIVPTYSDCLRNLSIGWSQQEAHIINRGLDRTDVPIPRDCPHFRHEQTLLNIHFYKNVASPIVRDLDKFAGWRSRHDHPQQVIWSHRRNGKPTYMTRIPFRGRAAVTGRIFGLRYRFRSWQVTHRWLFNVRAHAKKLTRTAQPRPPREQP